MLLFELESSQSIDCEFDSIDADGGGGSGSGRDAGGGGAGSAVW